MSILRRLGLGGRREADAAEGETETVRRIAARLERLPLEERRFVAAFAYVLARVAHVDLRIEESEAAAMERIVSLQAGLGPEEAALAVEIAKRHAELLGGTENYVVTREFRRISSPEQRLRLVDCLYAVAAADDSVTNLESSEIAAIADELGVEQAELTEIRSRYREKLGVLKRPASP
jgi:uncharacterized tellurite resistance protein B-like protein